MSPIRIVILAFLFYILLRLLIGGRKKAVAPENRSGKISAQDVLVEDPFCHTYIPMKQAVSAKHGETIYYFCSKECQEKYTDTKGDQK